MFFSQNQDVVSSSNVIFDDGGQVESFAQFEMPAREPRFDAAENKEESETHIEGLQREKESEEEMSDAENFQSFENGGSEESSESKKGEEEPVPFRTRTLRDRQALRRPRRYDDYVMNESNIDKAMN